VLILPTPPLFDAPLGVTPFEFCAEIWQQKIRIVELPDGKWYKKAVLPQGNRAMLQVFFSVEVRQQHSLQV